MYPENYYKNLLLKYNYNVNHYIFINIHITVCYSSAMYREKIHMEQNKKYVTGEKIRMEQRLSNDDFRQKNMKKII